MPKKRTSSKLAKGPWWMPLLKTGAGIALKTAGKVLDHWLNPDEVTPASSRKSQKKVPGSKKPTTRSTTPWWKVLDISKTATQAEIKAAYREQMNLTHPDKVAHLSKTLQKAAEREAKKLNQAYTEALSYLAANEQ